MSETCEICKKESSKYCCPKCSVLYCSLTCYKDEQHLSCSEDFYRANVVEELKLQTGDSSSKQHMIELLQKFEEENEFIEELPLDSDDEEDTGDIGERLANVNLEDSEEVWSRLTTQEQQEFEAMLANGEILNLMPKNDPWYIREEPILTVDAGKVKNFNQISSREPAAIVKFNLLNILAAYSYMNRYFVDGFEEFLFEACNCLCILSASLRRNCDFTTNQMAIKSIFIEALSYQFEVDNEMEPIVVDDVYKIISMKEGEYILISLMNMHQMMTKMKKKVKEDKANEGKFAKKFQDKTNQVPNNFSKDTWAMVIKRLEYFLAYTKSYYSKEILQTI